MKSLKKKTTLQNLLTYAIVIAFWVFIQLWSMAGQMTSLLNGLLVPICTYVILAPTHMNPAWPRLSSPKMPTVRFRETAKIT